MTEPRFKVSDGVYVPSDRGLKDPYRGAGGKVIKVNPGTGPDAQIGDSSDRILWTSLPLLIWLISGHPLGRSGLTRRHWSGIQVRTLPTVGSPLVLSDPMKEGHQRIPRSPGGKDAA